MLSVIIPIYNRAKTLDVCISSVRNADYKDLEIILVDDGSTDDSLKICKRHERLDKRIKVITQKNGGVSSARNMGIANAHGDWVSFVDSDDAVNHNHFSLIDDAEKINADLTMCMFTQGKIEKGILSVPKMNGNPEFSVFQGRENILNFLYDGINPYLHSNFFCHDKCFRRSIINKYGISFPLEVSLGEDQCFVCDYLKHVDILLYSPRKTYIRVLWNMEETEYTLGGMPRSNADYFVNIKRNYDGLKDLFEASRNIFVFKYCMNYLLDRPLQMMVIRRCRTCLEQRKNQDLIMDGLSKSKSLIEKGRENLNCVKNIQIRMLDWCLLYLGNTITMLLIRIMVDYNYIKEGIKYRLSRINE